MTRLFRLCLLAVVATIVTSAPCTSSAPTRAPCVPKATKAPCAPQTTTTTTTTITTPVPCVTTTVAMAQPCETTTISYNPCSTATTTTTSTTPVPCVTTTVAQAQPCEPTTVASKPCETTTAALDPCATTTSTTTTTSAPCVTTTAAQPCETTTVAHNPCEATTTARSPCGTATVASTEEVSTDFMPTLIIEPFGPPFEDIRCRDGWIRFESSCYYVERSEKMPFGKAEQHCLAMAATLFVPNSEQEFKTIFGDAPLNTWTWLGLRRAKIEDDAYWNVDDAAYNFTKLDWLNNNPYGDAVNGWTSVSQCAAFWNPSSSIGKYLFFYPCDYSFYYICEENLTSRHIKSIV